MNEIIVIIYFSILFLKSDNTKPIPTTKSTIFHIVLPKAIFIKGWNKIASAKYINTSFLLLGSFAE